MRKRSRARKTLVRALDKAFSEYIRARDGKCVTCGSKSNLTCGHLFSRVSYSTRWNPKNAFCQCWACNFKHEYDAYPLMVYAINHLSKDEVDAMHQEYSRPIKYKDYQLEEMTEHYKKLKKGLDKQ